MSQPLILLIQDPLLGELYSATLTRSGQSPLAVSTPAELSQLLGSVSGPPRALLLDPVLCFGPSRGSLEPALAWCAAQNVPVCTLPTPLEPLVRSAQKLGIHSVASQSQPLAALAQCLNPVLPGLTPSEPDLESRTKIVAALPEKLGLLQTALRATASQPSSRPEHSLLHQAHALALLSGVVCPNAHFQLTRAILETVLELFQPAASTQQLCRTLAQGLDLFSALLDHQQLPEPQSPVLVVEDDPNTSQLICAALEFVDLTPLPALNAEDGLELAGSNPLGLVLLDIGLPTMNGLEFCRRLRALPVHRSTPVVFLTGMTDLSNRLQSNLNGGNDFVCKPFNVHELGLKSVLWALRHRFPASSTKPESGVGI